MVEKDILEDKVEERKEKFEEEEVEVEETEETKKSTEEKISGHKERFEERFEERKEKGKIYSEKFANDLNKTVEDFKESVKNMQKYADDKINEYKNATVSNLAVDLIEADDIYYLKVAVPGLSKDEIEIEASDNDIVISATFKPFIEELDALRGIEVDEDDEECEECEVEDDVRIIASELTVGRCSKTVRFENSIEVENIKAKYTMGVVIITIPKLIIPKHKVTVE